MVFETASFDHIVKTIPYIFNTLILSSYVVVLGLTCAYILTAQKRRIPDPTKTVMFNICGFGYAVPGIILGLGILLMSSLFSALGVLITGTIAFLVLGYVIRFLNVALQGLEAGYDKMSPSILEASHMMQHNSFDNFWYVKLPY